VKGTAFPHHQTELAVPEDQQRHHIHRHIHRSPEMYLNLGTWHFVHNRWMFVLDKNIPWHYRQHQSHHQPWHWTTANTGQAGQTPLHLQQAQHQPLMDVDGTFQLLREVCFPLYIPFFLF
jgi:hypothetical protein